MPLETTKSLLWYRPNDVSETEGTVIIVMAIEDEIPRWGPSTTLQ